MAIITIDYSKATPVKAIDYITGKASIVGCSNLLDWNGDPSIPNSLSYAQQMMATARTHQKAMAEDDRKYYHLKLSFDPKDRVENGGHLTDELAMQVGMQIMDEVFPGGESVGAVHDDRDHLHFHGVSNAVNLETGKMVDIRQQDYRKIKDRVQEICREHGLHDIDWREATRAKRERENQPEFPEAQTFAEKGLQGRGKAVWKDQLRDLIDQAATSCTTMDEFREQLQANGVTLTRCTDTTISYKMGDHKACRGDTLGADYTVAAIRDALEHNHEPESPHMSLDAKISNAEGRSAGGIPVSLEHRQIARQLGRLAGIPRGDIDAMCDEAPKATWEEKQDAWASCMAQKDDFWREYNIQNQAIREELDKAYKRRRQARQIEWLIDPRNRKTSLLGIIVALIYLATHDSVWVTDVKIDQLKRQQQSLREEATAFKAKSGKAVETLRQKGLTLDEYMANIKDLQKQAESIRWQNDLMLDPEELQQKREQEAIRRLQQKQENDRLRKAQKDANRHAKKGYNPGGGAPGGGAPGGGFDSR